MAAWKSRKPIRLREFRRSDVPTIVVHLEEEDDRRMLNRGFGPLTVARIEVREGGRKAYVSIGVYDSGRCAGLQVSLNSMRQDRDIRRTVHSFPWIEIEEDERDDA